MATERTVSPDEIDKERVKLLLRQVPLVLTVGLVNMLIVTAVLFPLVPTSELTLWASALALTIVTRGWFWWRHREVSDIRDLQRVIREIVYGSATSGLLWGGGAAILLPSDAGGRAFIAFVIAGMAAGAVAALSFYPRALYAFLATSTLPLAVRLAIEGTTFGIAMGGMIVVFALALSVVGYGFGRTIHRMLTLQAEKESLVAQLSTTMKVQLETAEQLHHSQKMQTVGQLTGGIAHDFNNILTVVQGNLELMTGKMGAESPLMRLATSAMAAARRGEDLTQQLLAFSRKQRVAPRRVQINDCVRNALNLARVSLGTEITLATDLDEGAWEAKLDPGQLENALLNLIINARDAMPMGGRLQIVTRNRQVLPEEGASVGPGDYIEITVRDTGVGMSPDVQARALEPFFTTKGAGRGTGLGLSTVHSCVRQTQGGLTIESAPGEGTTITILLPRATEDVKTADQTGQPVGLSG